MGLYPQSVLIPSENNSQKEQHRMGRRETSTKMFLSASYMPKSGDFVPYFQEKAWENPPFFSTHDVQVPSWSWFPWATSATATAGAVRLAMRVKPRTKMGCFH
jgi:hypothetical protein